MPKIPTPESAVISSIATTYFLVVGDPTFMFGAAAFITVWGMSCNLLGRLS